MKKICSPGSKIFCAGLFLIVSLGCQQGRSAKVFPEEAEVTAVASEEEKAKRDAILQEFFYGCALKFPLYSRERQQCLDKGLEADPTIAYLWQQKAIPLFKQGKYEVGMEFINQAVTHDPERYLPLWAFIKCIFAKTYTEAIADLELCLKRYGDSYVMDHTFKFHIALSLLQLNRFAEAEAVFAEDIGEQVAEWRESHHLDLFYFGISKYEQGNYEGAIVEFDRALVIYPEFAEVQYYKYVCLMNLGRTEEAKLFLVSAEKNGRAGNTINEDNVIYERYPYQVRW